MSQPDQRYTSSRIHVHRYFTLVDGVRTRELQLMTQLQVKTHSGKLGNLQRDLLYKQHFCLNRDIQHPGQFVSHFGVSILSMDGSTPDDSTFLRWGRFNHFGQVIWRAIEEANLLELLRFDVDPDSLRQISFHRDAANISILKYELDDLGQPLPSSSIQERLM